MRICLSVSRVRGEDQPPCRRYAFDQDEVLLGRDQAVEVRLPDPAISLVHLRLRRKKGQLFVLDAGSTNGSWLDGQPLQRDQPVAIKPGACLALGPYVVRLEDPVQSPLTSPADTSRLAREMVLAALGALDGRHPVLEIASGPGQGARLELRPGPPLLVGRGEDCALRLEDADASRHHLELRRQGEQVLCRDLGSKNGLQINDEHCPGPRLLAGGDRILVGRTWLRFLDPATRYLEELSQPVLPAPPVREPTPQEGPPADEKAAPLEAARPAAPRPPAPASLQLVFWCAALLLGAGLLALAYLLL